MKTTLIDWLSRAMGAMPLALNQAIGRGIARLAWHAHGRARRVTEFNIKHCFGHMDAKQQHALAFNSLAHTGQQLTECAWIWHQKPERVKDRIQQATGEHLLKEAVESSQGVIITSPHTGNWELSNLVLSAIGELTYFYKHPRQSALGPLLLKWRGRLGGKSASMDASGIRQALRVLKQGGMLGMLPDQEPEPENGVYAPFFNQPALTMTLLSRLAVRSNAHVILLVLERLPKAQGWRAHYLPADPGIFDPDPQAAAAALNRDVERCIAIAPEQYIWSYKRFNTLADGTRRQYPRQQ